MALDERPIRLKQLLRTLQTRPALICMFLALLELVRLQAIQLKQDQVFGDILLRKHSEFDRVVQEQTATARADRRRVTSAEGMSGSTGSAALMTLLDDALDG